MSVIPAIKFDDMDSPGSAMVTYPSIIFALNKVGVLHEKVIRPPGIAQINIQCSSDNINVLCGKLISSVCREIDRAQFLAKCRPFPLSISAPAVIRAQGVYLCNY